MKELKDLLQSENWKTEKHVPVIESPDVVKKGDMFNVTVTIGKEIAHPNKTDHHIQWIDIYFHPEDSKFPYQIGKAEFTSHGASIKGADTSTVYTHHEVTMSFKTDLSGIIFASSSCNIHGLWQNSKQLIVE
ncbi:MAG: class II SORL domain-containing protein [bacterium]